MKKWNRSYHNIGIKYEQDIIRVKNDESLKEYFKDKKGKAIDLSRYIKNEYQVKKQMPLMITDRSLATEIFMHFYIQEKAIAIQSHLLWKGMIFRFCQWILLHMEVIDCGEKKRDNNRFVWDWLSIFLMNK